MIIVALPASPCEPELSASAQFCMDVAQADVKPSQLWVLGGTGPIPQSLSERYPDIAIRRAVLDRKTWPQDVGSNPILALPLTLYQEFSAHSAAHDLTAIYTPLHGASSYFVQMALKGGLAAKPVAIHTTCYLPKSLAFPAGLILPTQYDDVVNCDMEAICAKASDTLWLTDERIKAQSLRALGLPLNHRAARIFSPKTPPKTPAKGNAAASARHILFCGEVSPVYGIDAFCDLAEILDAQGKIDKITLITPKRTTQWSSNIRKRLHALRAVVNWADNADVSQAISSAMPAVMIAPMRAPVMPLSVSLARSLGMMCIWGQGFVLTGVKPRVQETLICTESDVRKILKVLETISKAPTAKALPAPQAIPVKTAPQKQPVKPYKPVTTLSVIILHHDRLDTLTHALHSLSVQSLKTFEIIVVDDGSSSVREDDIKAAIEPFSFDNISLHRIENSYPSAARNHGAMLAKGDAIFFLDDDNVLAPPALEGFLKAIQTHDLALSFYQTFQGSAAPKPNETPQGQPEKLGLCYGFAGLLPGAGLFYNILGNSSFMMRRDAFITMGGFTPKYGVGLEDYAFLLRASQHADLKWVMLPEPYLHFRLHGNKIRNSHVDWRSPKRLQAGQWRLIDDLGGEKVHLSPAALAYARQLHEITQYSYVHAPRPKFLRLKSVLKHQYVRPWLAKFSGLRQHYLSFAGSESRLAKWLEKRL